MRPDEAGLGSTVEARSARWEGSVVERRDIAREAQVEKKSASIYVGKCGGDKIAYLAGKRGGGQGQ